MKNFLKYIFTLAITAWIFVLWLSSWVIFNNEFKQLCEKYETCAELLVIYWNKPSSEIKSEISLDKFWQVYSILKEKAVEEEKLKDTKHIEDSVIWWLVRSLDDPYSVYMTEKENEEFHEDLAWNFEWIWAELSMKDEYITIVSPLKESPAIKAWIMPQDIILKVDWTDISWWALTDVVKKIRWPKWTDVTLLIARKWEDPKEFIITRDVIHVPSVKYELKKDIAYISVNQFWDSTVKEFLESIQQAEKDDIKWAVMDLRFNWWWYLDSSILLASPFINIWDLVTAIKSKEWTDEKRAIKIDSKLKKLPLVVLINQWSASASEIVAWALRDHKKAILVWETSYGKWTVQELINLSWNSSVRITTAKWYTPNWLNIHKVWITPDIILPRTFEQIKNQIDPQLDKAIEVINEWNFDNYFNEKTSLTWSAVIEYDWSGSLVDKKVLNK